MCDVNMQPGLGATREMLLQRGSRVGVCPNGEPRGRWVPLYTTRLNKGSGTVCIQWEEPGERELREKEQREESRELRQKLGCWKLEKSTIKTEIGLVRELYVTIKSERHLVPSSNRNWETQANRQ